MGRVARKQLRSLKENGINYEVEENITRQHLVQKVNLKLKTIKPLTDNQSRSFNAFYNDKNVLLHGLAGTGKTFISLYLALKEVLSNNSDFKKIYLVRSVVPTRDIGFLPGNQKEKVKAYEAPYYAICTELFGRADAYEILKAKGVIEFVTTSFIRGTTLSNGIIIVDECQNMTFHELDSVITRVGNFCKILISGDFRQTDLRKGEKSGIQEFMNILDNMGCFEYVEFDEDDIVRSGLVKEYIIVKDRLGYHSQAV